MSTMEAIRAALVGDAAVGTLVGAKVFASKATQGTPAPYIVCRIISDIDENTLAEEGNHLVNSRVQIDCYGSTEKSAAAVARAVKAVLVALENPDGLSCLRVGGHESWENEAELHCNSSDYSVWGPD